MPKAIDDHTPRRRGVLGGAAALLCGAAVPAAAMPDTLVGTATDPASGTPDDDAPLLALIAAYGPSAARMPSNSMPAILA
jgi:hypothetical protein